MVRDGINGRHIRCGLRGSISTGRHEGHCPDLGEDAKAEEIVNFSQRVGFVLQNGNRGVAVLPCVEHFKTGRRLNGFGFFPDN